MRPRRALLAILSALAGLVPAVSGTAASASESAPAVAVIIQTDPIVYMTDTVNGHPCSAPPTPVLHYSVFYPERHAGMTYPIVFGFAGAGFGGSSDCGPNGENRWTDLDTEMQTWAEAGFVAVNVEYHGYDDGLFGDSTCPQKRCLPPWGTAADGSVERNIKVAVQYFFDHDPRGLYGANERKGVIAYGGSAGGHAAYMLAITSPVAGHRIAAAIGWSSMGDPALAGDVALAPYESYIQNANATSTKFLFGSPKQRIVGSSPAMYIANNQGEFVDPASAESYYAQCVAAGVSLCYERIVDDGPRHGTDYEAYAFVGPSDPNEIANPPATIGMTVFQDSICFAKKVLAIPDSTCPA